MGISPVGLRAPFPYLGNKARFAHEVNRRLGVTDVYAEPFAGSLGVLLNRPPARREVVCDRSGHICNFWRAMQADPEAVAEAADWPTIHHDLTAWHRYLTAWGLEHAEQLCADPKFYDAEAAGKWAWGKSNWIGNDWCLVDSDRVPHYWGLDDRRGVKDKMPFAGGSVTERQGCARNRDRDGIPFMGNIPFAARGVGRVGPNTKGVPTGDSMPHVSSKPGAGVGVTASEVRRAADKRPKVGGKPSDGAGVVAAEVRDSQPHHGCFPGGRGVTPYPGGEHPANNLLPWFRRLQERLRHVIVLNRDWTSAVTPSVLCDTPSNTPGTKRAVLLDPPYLTAKRGGGHYESDRDGTSDDVARAAYDWACEHGERYRVAYCSFVGDFDIPDGWTSLESAVQHDRQAEQIMFSPACEDVQRQGALFA